MGGTFARPVSTFSAAGDRAISAMLADFYTGRGTWRLCNRNSCGATNADWGADAATYTAYLRWRLTGDKRVVPVLRALARTAPQYPAPCAAAPCSAWSDTPAWDAVASMREYELFHRPAELERAEAALAYTQRSAAFFTGACPSIPYQRPPQDGSDVKTLETVANAVKADLLIYRATRHRYYLSAARSGYDAARRYFLNRRLSLYTVHVQDDGATCTQVRDRFFASVNGAMIWNGLDLARITGDRRYMQEALATAHAVDNRLSDARGVFADIQGENDVVEPLVEAMYDVATQTSATFARTWLLRNAAAALASRNHHGSFARFFDGPPQRTTSIWEANGGFALEIAAAALAPSVDALLPGAGWNARDDAGVMVTSLPATIQVNGTGIALVGTMSRLCEHAHVRILIDGKQPTDRTGLWQNPSMPGSTSVLFAWRWVEPGHHTIELTQNPRTALRTAHALALQARLLGR